VHGIDRDVAARVAGADDEHALALELLGVLVGRGVQQLPVEPAFERGHVGFGQGAVGDDHTLVDGAVLAAIGVLHGHAPG